MKTTRRPGMPVTRLLLGLLVTTGVTSPAESPCDSGAIGTQLYHVTTQLARLEQQLAAQSTARRKVAFSARFSADDADQGIHLERQSTLKFDLVPLNIGNGYNGLTGIFTAPVAGLYVFTVSSMSTSGRAGVRLGLVAQGVDKAQTWGQGRGDPDDQDTKTVPVQLDEGDQVWVAQKHGDGVRGGYWTTFSGFLVQAD